MNAPIWRSARSMSAKLGCVGSADRDIEYRIKFLQSSLPYNSSPIRKIEVLQPREPNRENGTRYFGPAQTKRPDRSPKAFTG
jgi:hypothetical protein